MPFDYLPQKINTGPWVTAYTLPELQRRGDARFVLPIISIDTPYQRCHGLGDLLLPPLFHEAMSEDLKDAIISRIGECFPRHGVGPNPPFSVAELPATTPRQPEPTDSDILAFSVDTAVEEHGPHLPLGTDTIQSYSVLRRLAEEEKRITIGRPLEYGQLTWGLPFGFSIDLTADLLTRYVTGYVDALVRSRRPQAFYVVDVHGSSVHREAIVEGLRRSVTDRWSFRWLHEPLAEFASARGDQHAGGVETALVERVSTQLTDPDWWPHRLPEIAAGQMSFEDAVTLTPDLKAFAKHVDDRQCNGVIGDIHNYRHLDAEDLFERMMSVARSDVQRLDRGDEAQASGEVLW